MFIFLGFLTSKSQELRQYTADDIADFLQDLETAVDGDIFELTTSGGLYKVDSQSVEIYADITIRAAAGLEERPVILMNQGGYESQVDYLVRLMVDDVDLVLDGIEFRGDNYATKYAIRTGKISDFTEYNGYDDPLYDGHTVVQWYSLYINNCVFNAIHKGSDGRGIILYPATRARLLKIENSIFTNIERDGINAYCDTDDLNGNGHWQFVDSMVVENTTFHKVGREAIQIRSSDTSEVSGLNKLYVNHCTFDSCAWNNADPGKYHTLKIDYVNAKIENSIFTNDVSDDYITRIYNPNASADYIGVYNLGGVDPETGLPNDTVYMADTIKTSNGSVVGENLWEGDPLYANPAVGDYTLAENSPYLGLASDGYALGDLRWDPNKIPANNADLANITINGTNLPAFDPEVLDYTLPLPSFITEVPEVIAFTLSPEASAVVTPASMLPGTTSILVTAEDGSTTQTYTVFMYVSAVNTQEVGNANQLDVYPNPSNGKFVITNQQGCDLSIIDLTGKTVYQKVNISNMEQVTIDLNSGMYFVSLVSENKKKVRRIIVR